MKEKVKKAKKASVIDLQRYTISTEEASKWSGIGINRLRAIMNEVDCPFVLYVGTRKRVKLDCFRKWLDTNQTI